MEGPFDEPEPVPEGNPASRDVGPSTHVPRPRKPAGGKALSRLLDMLESRGFDDVAQSTIAIAVPEEIRPQFDADRARTTARPEATDDGATTAPAARRGSRRARTTDDTAPSEHAKTAAAPTSPPST
jgi:hypothetical protein